MRKPCLDCGTPTTNTRCPTCQTPRNRERNRRRLHYQGDYQTRARKLKTEHPTGPCWLCGQPIPPDEWSAHHVDEGNPASPLVPTHLSCNASHGDGTHQ